MYFPYPDKSTPSLQGVGAYHAAKAATPVRTVSATGAYHVAKATAPVASADGLGRLPDEYPPIRSPWYAEQTPWPYIKGPNFTRPVFKEHSRQGNFVPYPIVRMPSLRGLGTEVVDASTVSPESICSAVQSIPEAHARCMRFNEALQKADAPTASKLQAQLDEADAACNSITDFAAWAQCYYSRLQTSWYENPVYLGGAIVGGCALLGLAVLALRRTSADSQGLVGSIT